MEHETASPLDQQEIERYRRHILLPEIGGTGQQKMKNARVLVIGAGGLGAQAFMTATTKPMFSALPDRAHSSPVAHAGKPAEPSA